MSDAAAREGSRIAAADGALPGPLCSPLADEEVEIAEPLAGVGRLPGRQ